MKLTIRHDQNSIDPSATYTEEQFAEVLAALENQYREAILAEYPDAEIAFEDSADTNWLVIKNSNAESFSEEQQIEDNIQRLTESVFEAGIFWI